MTDTDTRKVAFGLLLLAVSTVLIFGPGTLSLAVPVVALAAGALLVGISEGGRPV